MADFIRLAPARVHAQNPTPITASRHSHTRTDDGDVDTAEGEVSGDLKSLVMESMHEVLDELETVYENVAKHAKEHIHSEYALLHSE